MNIVGINRTKISSFVKKNFAINKSFSLGKNQLVLRYDKSLDRVQGFSYFWEKYYVGEQNKAELVEHWDKYYVCEQDKVELVECREKFCDNEQDKVTELRESRGVAPQTL